jgi:hypothetical protein
LIILIIKNAKCLANHNISIGDRMWWKSREKLIGREMRKQKQVRKCVHIVTVPALSLRCFLCTFNSWMLSFEAGRPSDVKASPVVQFTRQRRTPLKLCASASMLS